VRWRKLGLVFEPPGDRPWLRSHASLPLAHAVGDEVRVYFASRDERNRSHVGWVELDPADPSRLRLGPRPALKPGPLGCFDDHGVYPGSLVERGDELWLYYAGWNPGARGPLFYASIGLAVSTDGGLTFERVSPAPLMARSRHDPCLVTSPCVLSDGGRFRMWYVSGLRWEETPDGPRSFYHVKSAESEDGMNWRRDGTVSIELGPGERNVARPCVRREAGVYRMWYCRNDGAGYRAGYAESADGERWTRRDAEAGIDVSPAGWDSEAIAYPWVFEHSGARYMLYNGNGYGRDGFGLAVEEED